MFVSSSLLGGKKLFASFLKHVQRTRCLGPADRDALIVICTTPQHASPTPLRVSCPPIMLRALSNFQQTCISLTHLAISDLYTTTHTIPCEWFWSYFLFFGWIFNFFGHMFVFWWFFDCPFFYRKSIVDFPQKTNIIKNKNIDVNNQKIIENNIIFLFFLIILSFFDNELYNRYLFKALGFFLNWRTWCSTWCTASCAACTLSVWAATFKQHNRLINSIGDKINN